MTPSAIVRHLDQYVIGQDEAKKVLAVAVYAHYRRVAAQSAGDVTLAKSNVLLVGPSGTGKTLTCETLSGLLGVPLLTYPLLSLPGGELAGIPASYWYLFGVWAGLIGLAAWVAERRG